MSITIPRSLSGTSGGFLLATSYTLDSLSSQGDMCHELAGLGGQEGQGLVHFDDRQSSSIASSFAQKFLSLLLHLNHYLVL